QPNPSKQPVENSLQATQQQMLQMQREMHEMFIHLQAQVDEVSAPRNNSGHSHQQSNFQQAQGTIIPRVVRLDFPRYDGTDDPITWIDRAEQFFEFHKTPANEKVALAAYHLEGGVHL
ncbi:hypothetical protein PanWU01x14_025640, partial [Parasponia andersonii]